MPIFIIDQDKCVTILFKVEKGSVERSSITAEKSHEFFDHTG
jgi:hypothetical protein